MAADAVISRELESLHQEVSASQRARPMPHDKPDPTSREADAQTIPLEDVAPQQQYGAGSKFVDAVAEFFEEAEKNVSAHPAAHVIGGVVVGILIGRLLGRGREP
jgi:ElaB/YqjD/DUF883 family membrane-anchored ribosome-binding protein